MSERQLTDDEVRQQAVVLLAAGFSLRETAEQVNRSHVTVWKWTQGEDFRARVSAAGAALAGVWEARMKALGSSALDTLAEVMGDAGAENKDRIAAARIILDRVAPATQKHEVKTDGLSEQEIEARLAALGFERKEGA